MPVVRTETLDISYEATGPEGGAPVLLVHGWPDAARGWHPVAERLNALGWRTVIPDLRGSGRTRFLTPSTPRDGSEVALAKDAVDLADALDLGRFAVVGHDWGARAAYTMAALWPERITAIAALAVAYQPRGEFVMPRFEQARRFWYQWLMYVDAGGDAIRADPAGYARVQWDSWSPPGWFTEEEFAATAESFANPDWVAITLHAYRSRFRAEEPSDARYDDARFRLAKIDRITVPALMVQGADDFCDPPSESEGLDGCFTEAYRRVVLDGVGHFPHRESPADVAALVDTHLDGAL